MAVPEWFSALLAVELEPWLRLSASQAAALYTHYEILNRWNKRMSLTSVEVGPERVKRHYCESLFLAAHLPDEKLRVADIGSGAGFPGVPMAVFRPEWQVTLVESVQKKAVFLREATRHVNNVHVVARRAEEVPGAFDWVVSRAVNPKDILAEIPRLAPRVALLVGEINYKLLESFATIAWLPPIQLPWGDRRICVLGEVPRET